MKIDEIERVVYMAVESRMLTRAHLYLLLTIKRLNSSINIEGLDKEINRIKTTMEQEDVKIVEGMIADEFK